MDGDFGAVTRKELAVAAAAAAAASTAALMSRTIWTLFALGLNY
jgi:hypothetical protein